MVMTSNKAGEVHMNSAYLAEYENLDNILFKVHSHPGQGATRGASWTQETKRGKTGGDMGIIIDLYKKNNALGKSIPIHYVYHQESKILYQYTPWDSDIFIRKINSYNNGLNFLIPKR